MKKFFVIVFVGFMVMSLSACKVEDQTAQSGSQTASSGEAAPVAAESGQSEDAHMIELTEKMYVTYINEIYTNFEDYIGRTIRLEGMFTSEYYEPNDTTYYYVYRVGPGCCGNDGSMCGFEFTWDGGEMPEDNDWIEVTGTLDQYDLDGTTYLTLRASDVEEKAERGAETLYQ